MYVCVEMFHVSWTKFFFLMIKAKSTESPIYMVISTFVEQKLRLSKVKQFVQSMKRSSDKWGHIDLSLYQYFSRGILNLYIIQRTRLRFFIVKDVQTIFFYDIGKYFSMVLTFKGMGTFSFQLKLRY